LNESTVTGRLRLSRAASQDREVRLSLDDDEHARKRLENRIYWDVVSERPRSVVHLISKMITEPHFLMSVVRKHLHFGKPKRFSILTTDRIVLEHQIFKHYAAHAELQNILFVGCDADTAGYHETYFHDRRFVTVEPNELNRDFGAREHIVGTLEELGKHIPAGSLDLIICNGVFGWGLDDRADCERAFGACFDALRPLANLSSDGTTFWNTGRSSWPACNPWRAFVLCSSSRCARRSFSPTQRTGTYSTSMQSRDGLSARHATNDRRCPLPGRESRPPTAADLPCRPSLTASARPSRADSC